MFTRKLNRIIFSVGMILFCFTISGCATGPQIAQPPPTITINTIPSGADISIQGNYIGKSPIAIAMPGVRTGRGYISVSDSPIQIEAQLTGYETKNVSFGKYHTETRDLYRNMFGTPVPGYPAKITPAYYTFSNETTIKLQPKK